MSVDPAGREASAQDLPGSCAAADAAHRTSVQFYHLTATPLERALPKLVEKIYGAGHRLLIVDSIPERLDMLNQVLWTYSTLTFLPHGSSKEPQPEDQPILLSADLASVILGDAQHRPGIHVTNNADILLVTDGTDVPDPSTFSRVLDIFDGNDKEALEKARNRWKNYQNSGHPLSYFRQTEQGNWEEKKLA